MSVCIPCAIFLLRKPHDNNESIEFKAHSLAQTRQTKHRKKRTEINTATNRNLAPKFRACADVIQLCPVVVVRTRPRAIMLAMIHMRKSIHGFPFVPLYGYGAPLGGLRPPELRYQE